RLTFEYALIAGENDSLECAEELGRLLHGMLVHVKLIPLNPVPGTGLQATPRRAVRDAAAAHRPTSHTARASARLRRSSRAARRPLHGAYRPRAGHRRSLRSVEGA